jgi:DNA-3-methyladenine glycosylase II
MANPESRTHDGPPAAEPPTAGAAERRRLAALKAVAHLRQSSPGLAAIIDQVGPHRPVLARRPFDALVASITQQQISMRAAQAIYDRVRDLCPARRLDAAHLARLPVRRLRSAGLTRQKAEYVRGLAAAFHDRRIRASSLRRMDDEQVITTLTALRGVGRWTAEMLLIFCLERPDVWPVDDLGLRRAADRFVGAAAPLTRRELHALGEPWRPHRSYAAWYLWRSLEGAKGQPGVRVP